MKLKFNVDVTREISEIILFFHLFSGTPLSEFRKLIFFISTSKKSFYRECFRKAEHACDMKRNIKRNILINFGQLENEFPPLIKQHANLEFLECEIAKNSALGLYIKSIKYKS